MALVNLEKIVERRKTIGLLRKEPWRQIIIQGK